MERPFLAIMIVGVIISMISLVTVLYSIWATEKNKADTLSLYAYLKMDQIKRVYDKCDQYMDALLGDQNNKPERKAEVLLDQSCTNNAAANHQDINRDTEMSEEQKEEEHFNKFMTR